MTKEEIRKQMNTRDEHEKALYRIIVKLDGIAIESDCWSGDEQVDLNRAALILHRCLKSQLRLDQSLKVILNFGEKRWKNN